MTIGADVFAGKLTKDFNVATGFKGQLTKSDGENIYVQVDSDGKFKDTIKECVGKEVILIGKLRVPGYQDKNRVPVLHVSSLLNGGIIVKRGRLAKEPELRYTPNGKQVVNFTLAVNYGYGDKQETDFIKCTIWGNDKEKNPAVTLAEKGTKGREILVKGRLRTGKDKDGNPFPEAIITEYEFIGAAPGQTQNNGSAKTTEDNSGWNDVGTMTDVDEDEIPF